MATRFLNSGSGVTAFVVSTAYALGARIVPAFADAGANNAVAKRYVWECTTAGTTAAANPTWSASYTPDVSTVVSGTATFTCRNPGYSSGSTVDWTFATIFYSYALLAANASGDVIKVHKAHTENVTADTTFTHTTNIAVICVDKDASDALDTMGTAAWIGNSTTNFSVTMAGAFRVYLYGITLRTAGATADSIALAATDGGHFEYESCYFWQGCTAGTSGINIGAADAQVFVKAKNCTFRLNATGQRIFVASKLVIEGGAYAATGSIPTAGLFLAAVTDSAGPSVDCIGFDISYLGANPIVGNATTNAFTVRLSQCKLGTSFVLLATQTNLNRSSAEVYVFDCSSGDTHGLFAYANPMGSVVSDTGIYFTSGAAAQSWKIVTTANCSYYTPFETPWFGYYNTVTTAITPYVEILRDGSATAYQDDEVWLDVMAKTNTGSTQSSLTTGRMTLLGTPANQDAGAGLGSWTGESGTAWSGKMVMASLTPAEVGRLSARVVVGEPSITVYADPQIRT